MSPNTHLTIASDVANALAAGRAVVALESTIIAHGMPYPRNLETAQAVEAIIRDEGAVPATIAVLDGHIHIGLDAPALERLATSPDVAKLSRRDMAFALAQRGDGATTVAATMLCAHMAGIRIFVTGGIGGVHRGADSSFDVSADLEELAQTPVAVICAGAKAILDLPKTLEYLETRGVPVIGYGTDEFPAFYCRSSDLPLDHRCDTPEQIAAIVRAQKSLPDAGGLVIANPIPASDALDRAELESAISQALADAAKDGIDGKDVTPFLLARLAKITDGKSLDANIALVKNNARVGARIAVALAG